MKLIFSVDTNYPHERELNTLPLTSTGGESSLGGGASNERERGLFTVYVSSTVTEKNAMCIIMPDPAGVYLVY